MMMQDMRLDSTMKDMSSNEAKIPINRRRRPSEKLPRLKRVAGQCSIRML